MDKPLRWLIAGIVIGVLVVVPLAVHDSHNQHRADPKARARDAREFIATWRKSRNVRYRATQTIRRLRGNSVILHRVIQIDQNPPDFSSKSDFNVELIAAKSIINCSKPRTEFICSKSPYLTWSALVKRETDALHDYFFSAAPIYEVTKDGNCYHLDDIYPRYPSPPYGEHATFCFNEKTDILMSTEVVRNDSKDIVTYDHIGAPKATDFTVPQNAQGVL